MIGYLQGEVIFSDGHEVIINSCTGIGYQIFFNEVLAEGSFVSLFISQIIKEDSHPLYGFNSLRAKKLFELLLTVKGIGPKSAYNLICAIGVEDLCCAIAMDNKKILMQSPGLGGKGAAQIILDLSQKIHKVKMYSASYSSMRKNSLITPAINSKNDKQMDSISLKDEDEVKINRSEILQETIMACKELGFSEQKIISIAQKILSESDIQKAEQLVHLVLKEI